MEFARLLEIVGDEPVFETGLLLAGDVAPTAVRRQLSRWTKAGRLYQLRRGLYALAPPFQKIKTVARSEALEYEYVELRTGAKAALTLLPALLVYTCNRRPTGITSYQSPVTSHQSPVTNHQSPVTNH